MRHQWRLRSKGGSKQRPFPPIASRDPSVEVRLTSMSLVHSSSMADVVGTSIGEYLHGFSGGCRGVLRG
jgi:hypothetical protein